MRLINWEWGYEGAVKSCERGREGRGREGRVMQGKHTGVVGTSEKERVGL